MMLSRRFHTLLVCTVIVVIVMVIMVVSQLQTGVGAAASGRVDARGLVGANVTSTRYTAKSINADTPTITNTSTPRRTSTPTPTGVVWYTAKSISAASEYTCVIRNNALLDNDTVTCWGSNYYGELGINDYMTWRPLDKVNLGTGHTAKSIIAADTHTCAILNDYRVKCWGGMIPGN